jgi:hypothetical protein
MKELNARIKLAGALGVGLLAGAALLAAAPANAGNLTSGIVPPVAPSTPSCGLGTQDYPDCPVSDDEERIAEGYKIAPVGLDMTGLDVKKVGIGSYWVNSAGACAGCHAGAGGEYIAGGDPHQLPANFPGGVYLFASVINPYNPPAIINPASYLAGGANFGNPNCDDAGGGGCGATLIVRNLTPDWSTGVPLPEGNTLANFKATLRTGHDFQQVHLNCPSTGTPPPYCLNAPSDGTKLQVMPWPALSNLTDYDLESIYAYLTAIPCISNAASQYPQIQHVCPAAPQANHHKYTYEKGQIKQLD